MVATKYGSYVIGEVIGEGGMGVVYKAQHAVLKKPACVKRLLSQFTRSPEIVTRFVNEAVAASGLEHPNIVQVYDCAQSADGDWFIALEFLKGVPLSKWIRGETAHGVAVRKEYQGYPIAPAQICRILVQAASALHKAHTYVGENVAGIIHRDVKPDNIFLVRGGEGPDANDLHVKLLDFGIAKLRDPEGEGMTRMGAIIGTPSYMAPEQLVNSKLVDPRADPTRWGSCCTRCSRAAGFLGTRRTAAALNPATSITGRSPSRHRIRAASIRTSALPSRSSSPDHSRAIRGNGFLRRWNGRARWPRWSPRMACIPADVKSCADSLRTCTTTTIPCSDADSRRSPSRAPMNRRGNHPCRRCR